MINPDLERWLVMPKTAMDNVVDSINVYFGVPDSGTETICQRIENGNNSAIFIITSSPKMGMRNGNESIKGKKVDNQEFDIFINNIPGVPTYKPLKSDNELIAEGWTI